MFRVTHPFHPWFGQEFPLAAIRRVWAEERLCFVTEDGVLHSLPMAWTDFAPLDPWLAVSAGRSWFRFQDLCQLAEFVRGRLLELERPVTAPGEAC